MGRAVGFRGPDDDLQVRVGGPGDRVPVECEIAHDGVVQVFDAGAAGGHLVICPPLPEQGERGGQLADQGELVAYRHNGFWAAMDTLRDKNYLEELWASKQAPWKVWE